jgi:hypothetical protein
MAKKDYILRTKAIKAVTGWETDPTDEELELALMDIPAADVAEVCRCKDCKYGDTGTDEDGRQFYKCIGIHYGGVSPTDYCSYGEREDG